MMFLDLPTELMELILHEILDLNTLVNWRLVCRKLENICSTHCPHKCTSFWHHLDRIVKDECLAMSCADLESKLLGMITLSSASYFQNYLDIYFHEAEKARQIGIRLSCFFLRGTEERKDRRMCIDTAKEILDVTFTHCGVLFPSEDEAWQYAGPYEYIFFGYLWIGHPEKASVLAEDIIVHLRKTKALGTEHVMQMWTEHRDGVV